MTDEQRQPPDAGWYRDPSTPHLARFWNGDTWTDRVHDGRRERQTAPQNRAAPPVGPPVTVRDLPRGRTPSGVGPLVVGLLLLGLVGPAIALHWGLPESGGAVVIARAWMLLAASIIAVGVALTVYGAASLAGPREPRPAADRRGSRRRNA